MRFIFQLGFNTELSLLELESVLGSKYKLTKVSQSEYSTDLDSLEFLQNIAARLGGTVKISDSHNKIIWHHSAKAWFKRDRLKPYANAKKGLLPPKIARILVNLAVGENLSGSQVLLDPFCGSGTILLEAFLLGLHVIGSDSDVGQLEGCRKNLLWGKVNNFKLLPSDATHIGSHLKQKINYIVTEPFLGRPNLNPQNMVNITKGLKKLYLGALKNWQLALAPNATVVMIFPQFNINNQSYITSSIIDDPSLSGYNCIKQGLLYHRPQARIIREIVILKYNGTRQSGR